MFPDCHHLVFDIAEDMPAARSAFRRCFNEIGKKFPEHYDALIRCIKMNFLYCLHSSIAILCTIRQIILTHTHTHTHTHSEAAIFMGRNNEVVLSIRCLPFWWWRKYPSMIIIIKIKHKLIRVCSHRNQNDSEYNDNNSSCKCPMLTDYWLMKI